MLVNDISIERTVSTGKYENIKVSVSAIPDIDKEIYESIEYLDTQIMTYCNKQRLQNFC